MSLMTVMEYLYGKNYQFISQIKFNRGNDGGASRYDSYLDTKVTIQYISRYISKYSKMLEGCHELHESSHL